jgi:hypothetical protein
MSFNEEEITNLDELEEGKKYFIKFNNYYNEYYNDFYNGIWTYTGSNENLLEFQRINLKFINLAHKMSIQKCRNNHRCYFRITNLINHDVKFDYFIGICDIFKLETTEYVLK